MLCMIPLFSKEGRGEILLELLQDCFEHTSQVFEKLSIRKTEYGQSSRSQAGITPLVTRHTTVSVMLSAI